MKKYLCFLFVLCMAISMAEIGYAEEQMSVSASVNYDTGIISVLCQSPARYGQKISVVLYKDGEEIVSPGQFARIEEIYADEYGSASAEFTMTDSDASGRYVVSVSGGGYLKDVSKASAVIYYANKSDINNQVIVGINGASGSTIEGIFRNSADILGLVIDAAYEAKKAEFNKTFLTIRDIDYKGVFANIKEIKDALISADSIIAIRKSASASGIKLTLEGNADELKIDIKSADYISFSDSICNVFFNLNKTSPVKSVTEIKKLFQQSIAIGTVNSSNVEQLTTKIKLYEDILGIDNYDYEKNINKYGEIEVNKAFNAMNFSTVLQVKTAYESRIKELANKKDSENVKSGGGGSGKVTSAVVGQPVSTKPQIQPQKINFPDIDDVAWAKQGILALGEMKIINGYADGTFKPNDTVSREEYIKMLVLAFDIYNKDSKCDFMDVEADEWYYSYIASAKEKGILTGYDDNTAGVGKNISRQDMAVMISRISEKLGIVFDAVTETTEFSDNDKIADYAKESVDKMQAAGIIKGMDENKFKPDNFLSRAEAAKVIYEIMLKK